MKTLYLIRHAKSDWGVAELKDIDRPLNARGYSDAYKMSSILREKKIAPDLIISSPAIRAMSTALIFCRNFQIDASQLIINSKLYDTSMKDYQNCISKIENHFSHVMLFGHNPTIADCAESFLTIFTEEMPTCGLVGIRSNAIKWSDFSEKKCELLFYDFPKNHLASRHLDL